MTAWLVVGLVYASVAVALFGSVAWAHRSEPDRWSLLAPLALLALLWIVTVPVALFQESREPRP